MAKHSSMKKSHAPVIEVAPSRTHPKRIAALKRSVAELQRQFELLVEVSLTVTAELSSDILLQKIVDTSRKLLGTKYAALGVLGHNNRIQQFITSGVSAALRKKIGAPPQGRGLLGTILHQGQAIRVPDISKDPQSAGFPLHHPVMKSLLGVPITFQGQILGNLYVADKKDDTEFSATDERLLQMFAAHAAVALNNARVYSQTAEERNTLAAIFNSVTAAVYTVDLQRQILTANRAATQNAGVNPASIIGRPCHDVFRYTDEVGRSICDYACPVTECITTGRPVGPQKGFLKRRDTNQAIPIAIHATPIIGEEGRIVRAVESVRDIRQELEVEELKANVISHVSHELRTPISHIKGFASSLLQPDVQWDEETQRDFIASIDREADRLSRLVSDLLVMSRIESGATAKVQRQFCDLGDVIKAGLEQVAPFTKNHKLKVALPAKAVRVWADGAQLEHVVANLVENAAKYSPEGTEIQIEAAEDGTEVVFSVCDHGVGIGQEDQQKIFEKFYRVQVPGLPRTPGTGLGLSICKGIVEQHGGRIWVESTPGKGSTFYFTVPTGPDGPSGRSE